MMLYSENLITSPFGRGHSHMQLYLLTAKFKTKPMIGEKSATDGDYFYLLNTPFNQFIKEDHIKYRETTIMNIIDDDK